MPVKVEDVIAEVEAQGTRDQLGLDELTDERFLLVERNLGAASDYQTHWFSAHRSMKAAADYWTSQDCREDWEPVLLVDLKSGRRYEPELTLDWTRVTKEIEV